jgi:hypothetical protein
MSLLFYQVMIGMSGRCNIKTPQDNAGEEEDVCIIMLNLYFNSAPSQC